MALETEKLIEACIELTAKTSFAQKECSDRVDAFAKATDALKKAFSDCLETHKKLGLENAASRVFIKANEEKAEELKDLIEGRLASEKSHYEGSLKEVDDIEKKLKDGKRVLTKTGVDYTPEQMVKLRKQYTNDLKNNKDAEKDLLKQISKIEKSVGEEKLSVQKNTKQMSQETTAVETAKKKARTAGEKAKKSIDAQASLLESLDVACSNLSKQVTIKSVVNLLKTQKSLGKATTALDVTKKALANAKSEDKKLVKEFGDLVKEVKDKKYDDVVKQIKESAKSDLTKTL